MKVPRRAASPGDVNCFKTAKLYYTRSREAARRSLIGDRPFDLIVRQEIEAAIAAARRLQQHGAY